MKQLTRLSEIAQQGIDEPLEEGIVDIARGVAKGAAAVLKGKGLRDAKKAFKKEQPVAKMETAFETELKKALDSAHTSIGRQISALSATLPAATKVKKTMESIHGGLATALALASKATIGEISGQLAVEKVGQDAYHIYEHPGYVKKYPSPLAAVKITVDPKNVNPAEPMWEVTYDTQLGQRLLHLDEVVASGARPVHPHKAPPGIEHDELPQSLRGDEEQPSTNTAGAPSSTGAPADRGAPQPAPPSPLSQLKIRNSKDTVKALKRVWSLWEQAGKPTNPQLKQQIRTMAVAVGIIHTPPPAPPPAPTPAPPPAPTPSP